MAIVLFYFIKISIALPLSDGAAETSVVYLLEYLFISQ